MRLLKIGRDSACDIVLHSDKVSSLHAELTMLNSGDITIEDKGSSNGTYVMNQRIKPGATVKVRRGDAIRFADVELQWSQVPMPEDNSAYQGVYGIGSHFNNDFQISGATVSRYHATVKHGKDGKFYFIDHSKNGSTVDGVKVPPHNPIRIKKKSSVVCGGVPVDLSRLPWPTDMWKYVTGIAASVAAVVLLVYAGMKIIVPSGPSVEVLQKATVCLVEDYYIEITFKDDPFASKIKGWPTKWYIGLVEAKNGEKEMAIDGSKENIKPFSTMGTAFFISEHGELGTNRHLARPWEYLNADQLDEIRQLIMKKKRSMSSDMGTYLQWAYENKILSYEDAIAYLGRLSESTYNISGSFEFMGTILTGSQVKNYMDIPACQVIATSDNDKKDVALLRLNSKKTPEDIVKNGFYDITTARVDETSLKPQNDELTIIGYPQEKGTGNTIISDGKEYLPTVHRTYISKTPDANMFQLQSNVVAGQSGSPVIDKKHNLVGVVWGSVRSTDVAYGCNIKHLKDLYEQHKVKE